jgi:hypothetical protein
MLNNTTVSSLPDEIYSRLACVHIFIFDGLEHHTDQCNQQRNTSTGMTTDRQQANSSSVKRETSTTDNVNVRTNSLSNRFVVIM